MESARAWVAGALSLSRHSRSSGGQGGNTTPSRRRCWRRAHGGSGTAT